MLDRIIKTTDANSLLEILIIDDNMIIDDIQVQNVLPYLNN